jgi:hypothetical protein
MEEQLKAASDRVLWSDIAICGDYQGTVIGVGLFENMILVFDEGYGSCELCGAWDDGSHFESGPQNLYDILRCSRACTNWNQVIEAFAEIDTGYFEEAYTWNEFVDAIEKLRPHLKEWSEHHLVKHGTDDDE